MSHFFLTVLVSAEDSRLATSDPTSYLEPKLAPFDEQTPNKKLMEFKDVEDEYLQQYETESVTKVKLEDGTLCYEWDERFRNGFDKVVPEELKRVELKHKDEYKTFEDYMNDFCGYNKRDKKMKRYGYWENPNAKWDWWVVGGRYTGIMGGYDPCKDPRNYERCIHCGGSGSRKDFDYSGEQGNWARAGQPIFPCVGTGCNACLGAGKLLKSPSHLLQIGNIDRVSNLPKDFGCFAFLTPKGVWIERGEMLMFGYVKEEKEEDVWKARIKEVLADHQDCLAIAVDCHI